MFLGYPQKEMVYFDTCNIDEMQNVFDLQHRVNQFQKRNQHNKLYSVLF